MPMDPCDEPLSALRQRLIALEDRLTEYQKTGVRESELEAKAVERTRQEMERRLNEMNEFRAQLATERATYVTRDMLETKISSVMARLEQNPLANAARIEAIQKRVEELERDRANLQGRFWAGGVALSALVTLLNWLLRMSGH